MELSNESDPQYNRVPLGGRLKKNTYYAGRLYGLGSMINHNCWPNVVITGENEFLATRDIKAGEELFVKYGCDVVKSI